MSAIKYKLPDYLESHGINISGNKLSCIFPDHIKDSTPSMSISKDGTYAKCFGACGRSMDIFIAANILERFPISGDEFITNNVLKLCDRFGITYQLHSTKQNSSSLVLKYQYLRAYEIVSNY